MTLAAVGKGMMRPAAFWAAGEKQERQPTSCGKQQPLHRVIESLRLEKTSEIIKSNHSSPPCLLNHVLKYHIHKFFEHLQGW